ncbi:MAG: peptidylprolyl isomerase [Planctomycetia bacterium]|nr:peptidylprolyl isomerase [Planctomycetia bacterium]
MNKRNRSCRSFVLFLGIGLLLGFVSSDAKAQWWKKKKTETQASEAVGDSSQWSVSDSSRARSIQGAAAASNSPPQSGNAAFMSREEQKEKEKSEAKKGIVIRFPWAKEKDEKEQTSDGEAARGSNAHNDPFGPAEFPESPAYQDMSQILQTQSSTPAGTVGAEVLPPSPQYSPAQAVPAVPAAQAYPPATLPSELPSGLPAGLPSELPTTPYSAVPADSPTPATHPAPETQTDSVAASSMFVEQSPFGRTNPNISPTESVLEQIPSLQMDSSDLANGNIQFYSYGRALAQVGTEVILAGDVMDKVDAIMAEEAAQIPPGQVELRREVLTRMFLRNAIEIKLVFCDIQRSMPAEGIKQNIQMIDNVFEKDELARRMKEANVTTREALDAWYRERGTTLLKQKYLFREAVLCSEWLRQNVPQNPDVSQPEMHDYYQAHLKDFETPPRARWEELVVRKSRFASREEAYREIVRIGSLVALQKTPFSEVAKQFSHGVTAAYGGEQDWVKPGDLISKPLEAALFAQPVGVLSAQVIEDENCFYIIRVLERDELTRLSFADAQPQIREKIKQQKAAEAHEKYLNKLRSEIPVFTIFDGIPSPEERMKQGQRSLF